MRTTLNIDDDLYAQAVKLTGIKEKSVLLQEALKALIEREISHQLAELGSSDPAISPIPRRQSVFDI